MIKFHYENETEESQLMFKDVKDNQFFISTGGSFCQKRSANSYSVIARDKGIPYSLHLCDVNFFMPIRRILPHVTKITWEDE
jgi:hypothetical protein